MVKFRCKSLAHKELDSQVVSGLPEGLRGRNDAAGWQAADGGSESERGRISDAIFACIGEAGAYIREHGK